MRVKSVVGLAIIVVSEATLLVGCDSSGTNPKMVDAPPASIAPSTPLPAEKIKGGGAASSGNMKRLPGASN
jgi:hypothetical protein